VRDEYGEQQWHDNCQERSWNSTWALYPLQILAWLHSCYQIQYLPETSVISLKFTKKVWFSCSENTY
jgi:hypothetical protein